MKRRILLASILAMVICLCCGILSACGTTYKVTWSTGEYTITAEGYDTLPEELKENTEVTFTVTPNAGWEVTGVTGAKQKDNKYTFTADKDVNIKVNVKEIISEIEVTKNPTKLTYEAGETLDAAGMEVTVKYATNRTETTTGYAIEYQNGETFSAGDTKFTVSYSGKTAEVDLSAKVIGTVTINFEGGVITNDELKVFQNLPGFVHDTKKDCISFTFDAPFAQDMNLPEPVKVINGTAFPFKNWNGANNGAIASGTKVNTVITATYEPKLLEILGLEFYTKTVTEEGAEVTVPYFAIRGNFDAATTAYLYLYEGNAFVELKGTVINKQAGTNAFLLEFDLREVTKGGYAPIMEKGEDGKDQPKRDEAGNIVREETLNENLYFGKWMDIKFQAQYGDRIETQEIVLNNYASDFVDLGDFIEFKIGDQMYHAGYQTWASGGSTSLKLQVQKTDTATEYRSKITTKLENREFDVTEGESTVKKTLPALVITFEAFDYSGKVDAAELAETFTNYIKDMQVLDAWTDVPMNKVFKALGESTDAKGNKVYTFELVLSIEKVELGKVNFMHLQSGNFSNAIVSSTASTLASSNANEEYRLSLYTSSESWKNGLVVVELVDTRSLDSVKATGAKLEKSGEDVFLVITANVEFTGFTAEDFAAKAASFIKFDVQGLGGNQDNKRLLNKAEDLAVTFTAGAVEGTGTVVIKIKINSLSENTTNKYSTHFGTTLANFNFITEEETAAGEYDKSMVDATPVTAGGKTYTLAYEPEFDSTKGREPEKNGDRKSHYYGCVGIAITDAAE